MQKSLPCGGGISIAYSGVHTCYQQALAASEAGYLSNFSCSVAPGTGKWGRIAQSLMGEKRLISRMAKGVERKFVRENPFPLMCHFASTRIRKKSQSWLSANDMFDRWASRFVADQGAKVFIGYETCSLHCLRAAKRAGLVTVVESPQAHPDFLNRLLATGAENLSIRPPEVDTDPRMAARRNEEYSLADFFFVYSKVHARSFDEFGFKTIEKFETPLWADPSLWPYSSRCKQRGLPLKVLFVGSVGLRKGIPWLLKAAEELGSQIELTILGGVEPDMTPFISNMPKNVRHVGSQPRSKLVEYYASADLFVLPSLLDTFGYVAMEAMMSGLPTIVSENCGVPVPDDSYRIPIMNSGAIVEALLRFIRDQERLEFESKKVHDFSTQFTVENYRKKVGSIYSNLLDR